MFLIKKDRKENGHGHQPLANGLFDVDVAATAARDRGSDSPAEPARKDQQGEKNLALGTIEVETGS